MTVPRQSKPWFLLLDVLRGPAAILVFAEHWRNLFFKDYPDLVSNGMTVRPTRWPGLSSAIPSSPYF